jgi:hypothetical protein
VLSQCTGLPQCSHTICQIILPALVGHVPDDMVRCVAALLDFAYLARRSSHDTTTLRQMEECLARFHQYRAVFVVAGIRERGFDLPRQHSLVHYVRCIFLFGSPNGLCSSITESKHIDAVKKPWRRSRRYKALLFMLRTNTRMSKIGAARVEFARKGMLSASLLEHAHREAEARLLLQQLVGDPDAHPDNFDWENEFMDDDDLEDAGHEDAEAHARAYPGGANDVGDAEGPKVDMTVVTLSSKPGICLPHRGCFRADCFAARSLTLADFTASVDYPSFPLLIRRFLHDYRCAYDNDLRSEDIPDDELPLFEGSISVHTSAAAVFYAPSELAGTGGMHRELIRSTDLWYQSYERRDTLLYHDPHSDVEDAPLDGLAVGRVLRFVSFASEDIRYSCALVEVFERTHDEVDELTTMWVVRPCHERGGRRRLALVHVDHIFRACHLIGRYGLNHLPPTFHFSHSHVAFRSFYLNHFADYHSHECLSRN